jgi:hypothetical protein
MGIKVIDRRIAPVLKDGFRIIINPRTQRATTLDNIIPYLGIVKVRVHTEVSNIFSDVESQIKWTVFF